MKLSIVSPQQKHEYQVEWIEAYTPSGAFTFKSGHAPIIVTLVPGADLSFLLSTGEKKIIKLVRPGFLEVNRVDALALLTQEDEII